VLLYFYVFIRFRRVVHLEEEPTEDGRVIVYYDRRGSVVAVEITDMAVL